MGLKVQFDEIYELTVDLDESDRNYSKIKAIYPEGRQPIILTIEEIYNGMHEGTWDGRNPQLPEVKGFNSYIDKNSIRMSKGIYTPKVLLFLADELNELMTSDDYKSVDLVKQALGSIARLGRAAAVHLALACQRASGSTISTDLKNNIQMSVLLGGFDDGASQLMFEKDISQLAKPEIKGRGFIGSGKDIIETQTYYTIPEHDWEFDTSQKMSYNNPVFTEQCKLRGLKLEELNTGWVPQRKIEEDTGDEIIDEEIDGEEDTEEVNEEELFRSREETSAHKNPNSKSEDKYKDESDPSDREKVRDGEDEAIKFKKSKIEAAKPEVSLSDLEKMFGSSDKKDSSINIHITSSTPNRDRIDEALKDVKVTDNKSTVTYDKTSVDPGSAPVNTTKIKLKLKPKA